MQRFLLSLTALTLFASLALAAPAAPKKPTAASGPPPQVAQAAQKFQQGDLKGSIALLEPLLKKPGVHPAVLALLGTLYLESERPKDALALLGPLADSGMAGPAVLHNAGRAALLLRQTPKAETYLRQAVAKAPGSPASRDLGMWLGTENRIAESYSLLRPWVKEHPDDEEARLAATYAALELDRAPEAAELITNLPENDPRARLLRGRLLYLQQQPQQAIAMLEPLLHGASSALELDARRYLASCYLAVGESATAIQTLQGRVENDPSLALVLARAQYLAGNAADAAATLAPFAGGSLAREPANAVEQSLQADVAFEYGQALVALAKWPEAIAALDVATRRAPQRFPAWQLLARAELAAGHRDDANRALETSRKLLAGQQGNSERVVGLERDTADPTGRNLKQAAALLGQGKGEEALKAIRQEISLAQAGDPRPRAAEVTTLLALKRNDEALKTAEAAVAAAPNNPDNVYLRGVVRMTLQQLPAAEKDFRRTLELRPDHLAALNDLAVLDLSQGHKDEARELLRKVLSLRPGDPMATKNLKTLEEK
ncbi:MAG TPA: tetratricopeptide repeat protein [Thermoanaerobaculia bacterium]|jgi:tetratricopeptide (TPR) repeat protein|nr:tetratricopeptide repeat protein [Thermoanaerobaculia bacterium]